MRNFKIIRFITIIVFTFFGQQIIGQDFSDDLENTTLVFNGIGSTKAEVIDNPFKEGINTSNKVLSISRNGFTDAWTGTFFSIETPFELTNRYFHIKIRKGKINKVKAKIEGTGGNLEVESVEAYSSTNQWTELKFDFNNYIGEVSTIVIMPDFEGEQANQENDAILVDDFTFSGTNDATLADHYTDDFESDGNATYNGVMSPIIEIVDNPTIGGINTSAKVLKIKRNGVTEAWVGTWFDVPAFNREFRYLHIKVLKNTSNPVKAKLSGAASVEIESINSPSTPGEWEDMVFDFDSYAGQVTTMSILPDFIEEISSQEETIYIDDIVFSNENSLSLEKKYSKLSLNIFPNPVINYFSINNLPKTGENSVNIFDSSGKKILSQTVSNNEIIKFEKFKTGIYFVEVLNNNEKIRSLKFVKK